MVKPAAAGPVVMDDPVVANDPDELAVVPALLVPSSSGKAALTELCAPLGALPELLRPPALAGADGTLPKPAADGPAPIAVERELPPPKPPSCTETASSKTATVEATTMEASAAKTTAVEAGTTNAAAVEAPATAATCRSGARRQNDNRSSCQQGYHRFVQHDRGP
jgi:hypothetical protein